MRNLVIFMVIFLTVLGYQAGLAVFVLGLLMWGQVSRLRSAVRCGSCLA